MIFSLFSKVDRGYKDITVADLKTLPPGTRLIDVREPGEYQADHLPQAELVPLGTLERTAAGWDKASPYVLICRSGNRSSRGASVLVQQGFSSVMNLSGGMSAVRSSSS